MASRSEPAGDLRAELVGPTLDRLAGDVYAPLGEELLGVPEAEAKAEMELDGVPDDGGREAMTLERDLG